METLTAEKEAVTVLNHEISSLTYRNQQLQQRLEVAESESLTSAVSQMADASSPGGGFRRRGSWSPLPKSAQKGKGTPVGTASAARDLQVERLREENERLQEEKQQLHEEATEARLENR